MAVQIVFDFDKLCIPLNHAHHWVLGVVDVKEKEIYTYDSAVSKMTGGFLSCGLRAWTWLCIM